MSIKHRIWGSRRRRITTVATTIVLIGAGSALAAWALSGDGSSGGTVGSPTNLTATADPSANQIYPGGAGDATFTIHNPNGFPVTVTDETLGAFAGDGNCTADDIYLNTAAYHVVVPIAANSSAQVVLANAYGGVADLSASCMGVDFSTPVTLVAHSG